MSADPPTASPHSLYESRENRPSLFRGHPRRRDASGHSRHPPSDRRIAVPLLTVLLLAALTGVGLLLRHNWMTRRPGALPEGAEAGLSAAPAAGLTNDVAPASASGPPPRGETGSAAVRHLIEGAARVADVQTEVDTLLRRGLVREAAEKVRRQLVATPGNVELKSLLASLYVSLKQYAPAAPLLEEVLQANPRDLEARLRLAQLHLEQGDAAAAYDLARWTLESSPGSLDAQMVAARACIKAGWYQVAVSHLRTVYDARRDDLEAQNLLAVVYLRLGQYGKAVNHLIDLIKQDKADAPTYYNLAVCYAQQKLAEDTVSTLNQAATKVGHMKVLQWVSSEDLSPVRNEPIMLALHDQLVRAAHGAAASSLTLVPRDMSKPDSGLGLLPEPEIGSRRGPLRPR